MPNRTLNHVLNGLWPVRQEVAKYSTVAELVWWCSHSQSSFDGGPKLSAGLMKRLGEFGGDLYIDNYFSPVDEP